MQTSNLSEVHSFQESIAIGFYNQVVIYGVNDLNSMSSLKELVIQELDEDLVCADYLYEENLLALGGALGVGYLYQLASTNKTPTENEPIDLDNDTEQQ